jgi:uncharacterized protein
MTGLKTAAAGLFALALSLAPASGWSQTPDPERLRLAHALFEAQGGAANITAAVGSLEKVMIDSLAQNNGLTPELRQTVVDALNQTMTRLTPRMVDDSAVIYAQEFTSQQLKDILAFYQSPTGRVLVAKLPEITQMSAQTVRKYTPQIQLDVLRAICAKTACPPAVQQNIEALKQAGAT